MFWALVARVAIRWPLEAHFEQSGLWWPERVSDPLQTHFELFWPLVARMALRWPLPGGSFCTVWALVIRLPLEIHFELFLALLARMVSDGL